MLLDANVLIGALEGGDRHHRRARELFVSWRERRTAPSISLVNLTEVLVEPARNRAKLSAAREAIGLLGVAVHRPNEAIGLDAAKLRGRHPVSLADAYCLATARHTGSTLASFDDKVLRAAEREGIGTAS